MMGPSRPCNLPRCRPLAMTNTRTARTGRGARSPAIIGIAEGAPIGPPAPRPIGAIQRKARHAVRTIAQTHTAPFAAGRTAIADMMTPVEDILQALAGFDRRIETGGRGEGHRLGSIRQAEG